MENRRTPDSAGLSNDLGKVAESSPRRPTSVPSDENHATLFGNWFRQTVLGGTGYSSRQKILPYPPSFPGLTTQDLPDQNHMQLYDRRVSSTLNVVPVPGMSERTTVVPGMSGVPGMSVLS